MSDLIDREAAIDAFYTATADGDKAEFCVDVIKGLPSVPAAPRWVRCEEPPTEDGDYLTYYADGYCAVNRWSKGWGWMYDEDAVRYWMPIEPPKEEQ